MKMTARATQCGSDRRRLLLAVQTWMLLVSRREMGLSSSGYGIRLLAALGLDAIAAVGLLLRLRQPISRHEAGRHCPYLNVCRHGSHS